MSDNQVPGYRDVVDAAQRIAGWAVPTPLIDSPVLAEAFDFRPFRGDFVEVPPQFLVGIVIARQDVLHVATIVVDLEPVRLRIDLFDLIVIAIPLKDLQELGIPGCGGGRFGASIGRNASPILRCFLGVLFRLCDFSLHLRGCACITVRFSTPLFVWNARHVFNPRPTVRFPAMVMPLRSKPGLTCF